MKKLNVWSLAAVVCLIGAAASWIGNRADASFVLATLGVLAWFLNLRGEFHRANAAREAENDEAVEREE